MNAFEIGVSAIVIVLALMALVAIRFPRGRADWPLEAGRTAWLLMSGLTAVIVLVLLYVATRDVRWPDVVTSAFAGAALFLALLAAVALFLPQGLRSRP